MIEFLIIISLIIATFVATICGYEMLVKIAKYETLDEELPDDEHPALPDFYQNVKWMIISLLWLLLFSTPGYSLLMVGIMFLTLMIRTSVDEE